MRLSALSKRARLITILTLIIAMFTSTLYVASAFEVEPKLGGGPSPSAAWEKVDSFTVNLSKKDIEELETIYQNAISSTKYKAGKRAYDASLAIAGFYVIKTLYVKESFEVTVGGLGAAAAGLFGKTYFSKIQNAANTASSLSSSMNQGDKKRVRIDVYARPANGEAMYILR